jgi:hypothetical protein
MIDLQWPYDDKNTTYIVSSQRCISLLLKSKKKFVSELKELGDIPIKKNVEFVADEALSDEFVYVVDDEGIQLVVDMVWPTEKEKKKSKSKKPIDFTKYDA